MPELPEVETVRRGLHPVLAGATLRRVEVRRPDLRFPFPPRFAERLTGARIDDLTRRGKYLLAPLDRGETLILHLGMTGRFDIETACGSTRPGLHALAAPTDPRHAHAVFETWTGARVTYFDARRFGFMDLAPTAGIRAHARFAGMGPEPLSAAFDAAYLEGRLEASVAPIKQRLLDQGLVAGLGNIYVNEALHRAGLSPLAPAADLDRGALGRLVAAIRAVLCEAIEAGGSTVRDFAGATGAQGYFQHDFRVYGRAGEACRGDGCGGRIVRVVQSGRATFLCPTCQP